MPATYDYTTGTYRLNCSGCGTHVTLGGYSAQHDRDALTIDGTLARDTFPFVTARGVFYSQCRTCDAARRAATRARRGTTRRATASAFRRTTLGSARKYDVEFECIAPRNISHYEVRDALRAAGLHASVGTYSARNEGQWLVKSDGSLTGGNGVEVTSPALSGDAGANELRVALRVLNELGCTTNASCGTHVHHDAADLTVDEIKRTVAAWAAQQSLTFGLVSPSRRSAYYAQRLTDSEVARVQQITTLSEMRNVGVERYRTLNLKAYGKFGTLEIRQHQGTLSFAKVSAWIALGQAFIDTAIAGDTLAQPMSAVRDLFAAMGDRINETARTFLIGRAVEFGAVAV